MDDFRIRAKGRFKLRELIREAQDVCRDYQHREYLPDLDDMMTKLIYDAAVEMGKQLHPPQEE